MHRTTVLHTLLLVSTLLGLAAPLLAQTFPGFSSTATTEQRTIEERFMAYPKPTQFKEHLQTLTQEPHVAGSDANNRVAAYMAEAMEKAGWSVESHPYDIYLPTGPGEIAIELVTPVRLPLNNKEYILAEDPFSKDPNLDPGWNSYSGSGDVTAPVVYANYGRKEDFEKLADMGISVKGKLVIARYGGNFRGFKAKFAEAAGAAGLIIYSDPADAGYMRGLPYPEGKFYNESTIQRGSVLTLPYTGDPLTPFEPALPVDGDQQVDRLDPSEVAFHTIPVTPIPYGSAKEILSRMTGLAVPGGWQGGLPFTYRIEGGEVLTVRLKVQQEKAITRTQNVVGTLMGSAYPDEWIILGAHFDAWSFGASDPNSGTAMLLTLADALGKLAADGFRPKRTIKIAHWDAEEFGILGSTEWVEEFRDELDAKCIAYFNADGACSGLTFSGSSTPSLKELLVQASQAVPYPNKDQSVYEHWMERASKDATEPQIGNLGGGSDHLPFYAHVGIPCLGAGMGGPTLYHSAYDNFYWYSKHADPDFVSGPTVAKVFGVMALRMANAQLLPLDVQRYGLDLEQHLTNAEKQIQAYQANYSLESLKAMARELAKKGAAWEKKCTELADKTDKDFSAWNRELLSLERSFIDDQGMPWGKWYRSLYASSDPYSGYASWMLPGFLYEASIQSTENLPELEKRYQAALERLANKIDKLLKM